MLDNILKLSGHIEDELPSYSETSIAARFVEQHGINLLYVAKWGRWLRWSGTRWVQDDTLQVFDISRSVCREVAFNIESPTRKATVTKAATVAAVERLAKADRSIAATVDQFDADNWLLNTPGGLIDLRTGERRSCDRHAYCTKITAVEPGGQCPNWHAFLDRVTNNNPDLMKFLQKMAGYCLTGITSEHALFFAYGTGANGKSVFLNTLAGLLGDYASIAPMELLMAVHSDRHPTEIASLRGARLVTAIETEEGRQWAEAKIKNLTGGDPISARFMRQDAFEFVPQFKLIVAGNHKPALRSVDEAIRRRLHLIPFGVTIPEEERDVDLPERLKAEWPGIMSWAIDGALAWRGERLKPPPVVRNATVEYLETEDATAQWIEDRCNIYASAFASIGELYGSWKSWAEEAGEFVGSKKRLSQQLEDRGYLRGREGGTGVRGFSGLMVKRSDEESPL